MDRNVRENSSRSGTGELWNCSPHPGGKPLTSRLADLVGIRGGCRVLDVAAGQGESTLYLAHEYGCQVVAVDLLAAMADRSLQRSLHSPLAHFLSFVVGDAEALPFRTASFDALLCECSFSLINRKTRAAREFCRVLRSRARIGIADFYVHPHATIPADKLGCCPPGTETQERYRTILQEAGFRDISFEDKTQNLKEHFLELLLTSTCADSLLDKLPTGPERAEHFRSIGYCVATGVKS